MDHVLKDFFSLKGDPGQKGEKGNSVYVAQFGRGPPVSVCEKKTYVVGKYVWQTMLFL